jgi:signal transduction histidine kinase
MAGSVISDSFFCESLSMLQAMLTLLPRCCGRAAGLCHLFFAGILACAEIESASLTSSAASLPVVTNLFQIREFGMQNPGVSHPVSLEGQVCWVSPKQNRFAMLDASGGLLLEMDGLNQPLRIGQQVRMTGTASFVRSRNIFRSGVNQLVVDDDGIHSMTERTGSVFLKAGRTPIQVEWFNGYGLFGLELSYEGPDLLRQEIPHSQLFASSGQTINQAHGLEGRYYEGWWTELPDFNRLQPVKTGTVDSFDLDMRRRNEGIGFQFSGFFEVPRDGIYTFHLNSDDGSRLSIGQSTVQVVLPGPDRLPAPRSMFVGQLLDEDEDCIWSRFEGKIMNVWVTEEGLRLELGVGSARMEAEITDEAERPERLLVGSLVRVTGLCRSASNADGLKVPDLLLVPGRRMVEVVAPPVRPGVAIPHPTGLTGLTTAAEVHHLKRAEAQLKYPVKVRGVVTSIDPSALGFTLQDSTGGVYVQGAVAVRVGDFVEAEGVTDPGEFAPMLIAGRVGRPREGRLPEPIHPTWDQLMNGSLDAQYVEIEGIVTSVSANGVQLLSHGGLILAQLQSNLSREEMNRYENTLIRIRGGLLAVWNPQSHQVRLGEVRIFSSQVVVEDAAPTNAFSAPYKTAEDLLLFDPQASLFQRIRMSGQIVHVGPEGYYMMAGTNGVRFVASTAETLRPGDTVDVAGYPQLGGASPLLRGAVIRKTGQAPLPEPRRLLPDQLGRAEFDSCRVRMDGVLAGMRESGAEMEMEMQDGVQNFVARMTGGRDFLLSLPIGSRLQLAGTYAVQGENQTSDQHLASFALLLDSPADIKVLARPPWWTLQRLLLAVGTLAGVLVIAVLWITQLHRKVEERTVQLQKQILKRQIIEQHRAMEQERARIARDLHDTLGSSLTEISMLAAGELARMDSMRHLDQISERSRQMVAALDEIVWAMNPEHDSIGSLGGYLCLYADRFLKLANIIFNLNGTLNLPEQTLNPIHRHEFFLAFKEALTNIVRHSGATEVRFSIRIIGKRLRVVLADDGGGLGPSRPVAGMDGLANMRARMEKMGGRFAIASQAGRGTTLRFYLPLT